VLYNKSLTKIVTSNMAAYNLTSHLKSVETLSTKTELHVYLSCILLFVYKVNYELNLTEPFKINIKI
jgi:hypothetical protein